MKTEQDIKNEMLFDALLEAGYNPSIIKKLTALIKIGADVNARNKVGKTALMMAVRKDDIPTVKFLIEMGADKEATWKNELGAVYTISSFCRSNEMRKLIMEDGDLRSKIEEELKKAMEEL